jgi:hypothetical protein
MMVKEKRLTFRALGRKPITGRVRNPDARLGDVAARVANRVGIAGAFEALDPRGRVISPDTPLDDLPEDEPVTLASDLTPA